MLSSSKVFCLRKVTTIGVIASIVFLVASIISLILAPNLHAAGLSLQTGVASAQGSGQPAALFGAGGVVNTLANMMLFIVGALSVVMVIFGGLRYVTSGGNAASVTGAKNTIMYAIVGLVVAFLAYAAINWLLQSLVGGSTTTNV